MLTAVHVVGPYWHEDEDRPTELGTRLGAAKDGGDRDALEWVGERVAGIAAGLDLGADVLVLPVPPAPDRAAHPVPELARAVADRLGAELGAALRRRNATARLRDTPVDGRRRVVEAAGYRVEGRVAGRSVLLVDDVVLTGTTLGFLAELLVDHGAADVQALVVCRTRRAAAD